MTNTELAKAIAANSNGHSCPDRKDCTCWVFNKAKEYIDRKYPEGPH